MAGYSYSERQISYWDWPAQATIYREMAINEAHNAHYWKAKYEALAGTQAQP